MTYTRLLLTAILAVVMTALPSHAQQLPNPGFEGTWTKCTPWTDGKGNKQIGENPPNWNISHVMGITTGLLAGTGKKEMGKKSEPGYNSNTAVVVTNDETGAMGITRVVPGYVTLGTPWSTAEGTKTSTHDGGTWGGISFSHRPDAISFYYKFTSNDTEPASFVAYLWKGSWSQEQVPVTITSSGSPEKTPKMTNRDRNIIFGINSTTTTGGQISCSENAKLIALINKTNNTVYSDWHNTIYEFDYLADDQPEMVNVIFSANDYFNTKSATKGNSLTIDDVKLIYYSRLESLSVGGVDVAGFSHDKFEYDFSNTVFPANTNVSHTLFGEGKSASVGEPKINKAAGTIEVTVTGVDADTDGEKKHTYTLKYKPFKAELTAVKINGKEYKPTGTSIALDQPWDEGMTVELIVNTDCSGTPKATFDPTSKKITVTNEAGGLSKTYTLTFLQPFYSRISSVTIAGKNYPVAADGKTIDATTLPLPMPENAAITPNVMTGGQGKPTADTKDKWKRDTEKGTIAFNVSNSEPDLDGEKSHTYTIQFPTPVVSRLKNIGIVPSTLFKPTTYEYNISKFTPETDDALEIELFEGCNLTPVIDRKDHPKNPTRQDLITITLNGNGPDFDGKDSHTYSLTFNKPSDEFRSTRLTSLTIKGLKIDQFDKDLFEYTVDSPMPEGLTEKDIEVTYHSSEHATSEGTTFKIKVNDPNKALLTILVEHPDDCVDEDGALTHEYTVQFLPYYSRLNSISASGETEEVFDQTGEEIEVHFSVKMPDAKDIIITLPEKSAGDIKVSEIVQNKDEATATLSVSNSRPDTDGVANRTYNLSFAMPHFSRLASLSLGGKEIDGFESTKYEYSISSVMPEEIVIEGTPMEGGQGTPIVHEPEIDRDHHRVSITVTNSRADTDGKDSHTYILTFQSANTAQLSSIAVNGVEIPGFSPGTYSYTLSGLLPAADKITATPLPSEGNISEPQITIDAETATATVTITNGELKGVYTLRFEKACPATLEGISVNGKAVAGFSPEKLTYDVEVKSMPSESGITVKLSDSRATAKIAVDTEAKLATITVTSPLAATEADAVKVYTLNFTIAQSVTPTPTPADGKTIYNGMLTIMMMGEDLTKGGQEAKVEIEDGKEGMCTFRLPDFSLDLGDGPASLGDIVVENVKVTTAADGSHTYEGEVKGMELAEGAIIADVTLNGTADANGKAHMVIKVNWEGIDIDVEFNGQAEEKPDVPVTPTPSDNMTIYNGTLTIMMMGEDLTKGGQEATVEIEDGEEGICTFRLPDFSLDLGDGPASLGDIVVENVKVTTAADGSRTYEGEVKGMELAEGAIIADVTLNGTADAEGVAHMVIKVNWEGIDIDVEFNGQAEEKPDVPVTPVIPPTGDWTVTDGTVTVEMNGYDITEGGTPATLRTAQMEDGTYTFMVPDFMLALDAGNTPANLGDIVVSGITASQLSASLTRYTGTVDNLSLAAGSIAANASIDGTIAADGTTVINVDVEWIMEDGRHVPIMVRFTNTPRSEATTEEVAYRGMLTTSVEGEPERTFDIILRLTPHTPGRCTATIEGMDFSPASRAAAIGHSISIPGVCVTPLADGMTGYDGNTSGISVRPDMTLDAILHGFTDRTGNHNLSLDLLWAEQGVRIAGSFDGHIDVTAITSPDSDRPEDDTNAEWYNLQGVRVNPANLRPGVYIKRTPSKTEKIVIP